jgi:hypothetical protein
MMVFEILFERANALGRSLLATLAAVGLAAACGAAQASSPAHLTDAEQAFADRMEVIPLARYGAALHPDGGALDFVRLKVRLLEFDLRSRPQAVRGIAPQPSVPFLCMSERDRGTLAQLEPLKVASNRVDHLYFVAPPAEHALATDAERNAYCARQDPLTFAEAPNADAVADAAVLFHSLLAIPPSEQKSRVWEDCERDEPGITREKYRQGPRCGLDLDHLSALTKVEESPCAREFRAARLLRFMSGPACLVFSFSDLTWSGDSQRFLNLSVTAERGKGEPHFYVFGGDNTEHYPSGIPQALRCRLAAGVGESRYLFTTEAIRRRFLDDYGPIADDRLPASGAPRRFILMWSYGPRRVMVVQDTQLRLAAYEERLDGGVDVIGTYTATPEDFCQVGARALGLTIRAVAQ